MIRYLVFISVFVSQSVSSQPLDLLKLIDAAIEHNPNFQAAIAETRVAKANLGAAKGGYRPQVNFSYGFVRNDAEAVQDGTTVAATDNLTTLVLEARQTLFDMTKWDQISQEEKRFALAALKQTDLEQQLTLDVVTAYLNLMRGRDDYQFAVKQLDAFISQMERAKSRLEVGMSTQNDVLEVQADLDNASAILIDARNIVDTRLQELIYVIGKNVTDIAGLNINSISGDYANRLSPDDLIDKAQRNNPNLKIASMDVEIAKNAISIASSRRLPTLELVAGYTEQDIQQLTVITADIKYVGLNFRLPIYQGGSLGAKAESARETYVAQSLRYKNQTNDVKRLVTVTTNTLKSLSSRIEAVSRLQQSVDEALVATEAGFEIGTRTVLDVLDATSNVYRVKAQLASAKYDYLYHALFLEYLTGNLDRTQIRGWLSAFS